MATPVELERLIVRLVGESSSYEKMMNNAIIKGQYVTDRLSVIGKRVEEALETLKMKGAALASTLDTPMERFNRRMANAGALLRTGAITYEQYGRAAKKVQEDLVKSQEKEFKDRTKALEATARGQRQVNEEKRRSDESYVKFWKKELDRIEREEKRVNEQRKKYYRQQERELERAEKFRERMYAKARLAEERQAKAAEVAAHRAYNAWNKSANNIARITRSAGQTMSFGVTAPIAAGGAGSVKQMMDFQDAMTGSLAVMENVSPKLKQQMEEMALNISDNSKTSAKDLAEGYYFLASAGYDAQQSLQALATVEKFAVAGRFQLQKATELLVDSQTALGMRSSDAEENMRNLVEVSDTLVKADTIANASVEQFARSLKTKAGNEARLLNKTVHETVAVLAAFASQGVKAELAGERVYIVWRDLQRAARTNAEAFEHFNVRVYDSEGRMRKTWEIVQDLEKAFGGMSDQQRNAAFAALGFQDRSSAAIKGLLGMSDAIKDYHDRLVDNNNFTQNVASVQLSSFAAQWQITLNRIRRVGIEIGEILLPYLERGISYIRSWVEWWRNLDETQKGVVVRNAAIVAGIGPMLIGISKLITLTVAARQAWVAFEVTMGVAQARAIALKGAVVGLAIGGIYLLSRAIYDANPNIKKFNDEMDRGNKLLEKQLDLENRRHARGEGNLEYEEKRLLEFEAAVKSAETAVKETYKQVAGSAPGGALGLGGALVLIGNKDIELAQKNLEAARKLYDNHLRNVEDLREKAKGKQPSDIPQVTASGEFADEDMPDFKALDKASKAIDRMNESLHTKYETLGLTANELKVYQMALEGAGDAELKRAMHEARAIDLFEREEKIMKEMAEAAEKSLTPWEKFRVEVAKLDELWGAGMIGVDGYRMKYAELESEMAKGLNLNFNVTGVDALEAGSAEAEARIEGFHRKRMMERMGIARAEAKARPEFREGSEVVGFGRGLGATVDSPTRLEELLEEIARNTGGSRTHAGKRVKPVEVDWANLEEE